MQSEYEDREEFIDERQIKCFQNCPELRDAFRYIIMLLVFSILAPSAFPTLSNVISILRQIAMLATISLGLTFV